MTRGHREEAKGEEGRWEEVVVVAPRGRLTAGTRRHGEDAALPRLCTPTCATCPFGPRVATNIITVRVTLN